MGHQTVEQAQAVINQFTANESQQTVEQPTQTVPSVQSANVRPEAIPVVADVPVAVVQEPQPVAVQTVAEDVSAIKEELRKMKASYSSLQGKYNKELPQSMKDNAQLQAEINLLKQDYNQQASAQEIPKAIEDARTRLGQERVDQLGEDYVDGAEEIANYAVQKAVAEAKAESEEKMQAIEERMHKQDWENYNRVLGASVPNFMELIDPMGDGKADVEFEQFLQSRLIGEVFYNADAEMDVNKVVTICNMYKDSQVAHVQAQVAPVQASVNPKMQAIAPPTTNNATPQSQTGNGSYSFKMSDYLHQADRFARKKSSESEWLQFEKQYQQAVVENKVDLTA